MNYSRYFIAVLICCLSFLCLSCKRENVLEKELKAFANTDFIFEKDSVISINISSEDMYNMLKQEYKLVVYIDSLALCSACWSKSISYIEFMIKDNSLDIRPFYIFKSDDILPIKFELEIKGMDIPYFIDNMGYLKRSNEKFPNREVLKTFLVKNNRVMVVGSFVGNKKMEDIYLSVLKNKELY